MLSGCAVEPTQPPVDAMSERDRATELGQSGDHTEAARIYTDLASTTTGADRDELLLRGGEQWYLAGDWERAQRTLAGIAGPLSPNDQITVGILEARIALAMDDPPRALGVLETLPGGATRDQTIELELIRADALFAAGDPVTGLETLMARGDLLLDPEAIIENERHIWNSLLEAAAHGPIPRPWLEIDPELAGWLELGALGASAGRNPFVIEREIEGWQERYPTHPANRRLIAEILDAYGALLGYPGQVALLLPLSGRQQSFGAAVRDGFLAAYFEHRRNADPPLLRIYDVSALGAGGAYQRALTDGAEFVVGPLTKPAVQETATVTDASVATLALNYLPAEAEIPTAFFQFGLAPEDEARQAAQRALSDGHETALALAPNNEWGRRLLRSFSSALEEGGGELLEYRFYDPQAQDFSAPITRLLLLDESRARRRKLSSALGARLEFEPRRRSDAQFIFLAAQPAQSRQIRPQLRFHFAADLPVYACSSSYQPHPSANTDLDGVIYPEIPWVLMPDDSAQETQSVLSQFWPSRVSRYGRLYALGFDAYRVVPLLYNEPEALATPVPGMTGSLTMDIQGRIHRELLWAYVVRGEPELLPTSDAQGVAPPDEDTPLALQPGGAMPRPD